MTTTIHDIRGASNPVDRLGRPLHDLRISVMDRCNFRCPYCMPKEQFHENYRFLKSQERLSFEEIVRLSRLFAGLGVRKLRLTGGEPLLRANLADLVGDLTGIPGIDDIALTTNGVLLSRHAIDLRANGLKRVTVSLDTLDPETFKRMSGGFGALEQVLEGIEAALDAGLAPIKVNTVVERGVNDDQVFALIERFRGRPVIVRFIEFMDVGNRNAWNPDLVVPSRELAARIGALSGRVALAVQYDLRNAMHDHLQAMDAANVDRMPTGQLVGRANSDSTLVQGLLNFFPIMSSNILLVVLSVGVMC